MPQRRKEMLVKSQCFSPIGVNSNLLVNINMKENQLTQLKNEIVLQWIFQTIGKQLFCTGAFPFLRLNVILPISQSDFSIGSWLQFPHIGESSLDNFEQLLGSHVTCSDVCVNTLYYNCHAACISLMTLFLVIQNQIIKPHGYCLIAVSN